jgi:hypothetical protein
MEPILIAIASIREKAENSTRNEPEDQFCRQMRAGLEAESIARQTAEALGK